MKFAIVVASLLFVMLASFAILLTLLPTGGWRYFLAGGVCASTSHAIATPIDVIKVFMEHHSSFFQTGRTHEYVFL